MKRFFYFMMTVVLVFSLAVTAFADDNGSITITNATVGKEYTLYKIFDATLNADKSGISYSVAPDSELAEEMFGDNSRGEDYFNYNDETGIVELALKNGKTEADLFEYLNTLKIYMERIGAPITAENTTVNFTKLPYGYYLISSTLGATVTIDSANPHADVNDKNQTTITLDKQIKLRDDTDYDADDSISANVGDTVDFKVSFTALNYKGEKKIDKYTITDTLNPAGWASINTDSIVVKVGEKTLAKGTDYKITPNENGFTIEIFWQDASGNFRYASSVPVEITYSATVLEAAAKKTPDDNKNTAVLTWGDATSDDETTTKVYNMGFTKVDGTNGTSLSGAKFELYSDDTCTTPVYVTPVTGTQGVYMVGGKSNEVITPDNGQVVIMGLKEGTYCLKETEAPAGYNLVKTATEVVIGDTNTDTITIGGTTYTVNNAELDIKNNQGVELPSTGGEGTTMLITIGSMVALAFAVLLITHKKMSVYHD